MWLVILGILGFIVTGKLASWDWAAALLPCWAALLAAGLAMAYDRHLG